MQLVGLHAEVIVALVEHSLGTKPTDTTVDAIKRALMRMDDLSDLL